MRKATWFEQPILALESSCDETAAAIVLETRILSNIIASQAKLHEAWGGIVPEVAARAHVETILPVIERALETAALRLEDIQAVAVTNRPGLVGALSVAVTVAKAIAFDRSIPIIGVHHLEGHLLSVFANGAQVPFPHLSLVASGGHTELVLVHRLGQYELVGQTIDDAAGEAFDKSARLLGLPYPGGVAIQEAARGGNPERYPVPRGLTRGGLDFSFSGLKTAMLRLVEKEGDALSVSDACASVEKAIVSVLAEKAVRAAEIFKAEAVTAVGGVAANVRLRTDLQAACLQIGVPFFTPAPELCTDNGAMIGIAGSFRLASGQEDTLSFETLPNSELPGLPQAETGIVIGH